MRALAVPILAVPARAMPVLSRQCLRRCRHRYYAHLVNRGRPLRDLWQDQEEEGRVLHHGHTLTIPTGGAVVDAHTIGLRALRRRTAQSMAQTLPDGVDVITAATIHVVTRMKEGRQQLVRSNC